MKAYKTLRNVNRKLYFGGFLGIEIVVVFALSLALIFVHFALCGIFVAAAVWWGKKNSKQVSEGDYEYPSAIQLQIKNIRKLDGGSI